ncbi:MAG: hypothetical protein PHF15_11700 [Rhodoferax sp.]|nr:hypothetical protein [Rhodoferax sp.]
MKTYQLVLTEWIDVAGVELLDRRIELQSERLRSEQEMSQSNQVLGEVRIDLLWT